LIPVSVFIRDLGLISVSILMLKLEKHLLRPFRKIDDDITIVYVALVKSATEDESKQS